MDEQQLIPEDGKFYRTTSGDLYYVIATACPFADISGCVGFIDGQKQALTWSLTEFNQHVECEVSSTSPEVTSALLYPVVGKRGA